MRNLNTQAMVANKNITIEYKTMNEKLIESLKLMIVDGNRLNLPDTAIENYAEVKRTLTKAGGKYSKCGFTFKGDAGEVLARLVGGEKIDDKKKYQFFATPESVVERMQRKLNMQPLCRLLEPSAGEAALVKEYAGTDALITMVELEPERVKALRKMDIGQVFEDDFMNGECMLNREFDRIIANPPFTKNQDVDHIRKMYQHLADGGIMVSLASKSWSQGNQKKQVAFRAWLLEVEAEIEELPAGMFKSSGTNIATMMIVIRK